jgi:hypothetical protein
MNATTDTSPQAVPRRNRTVETIRGQYHRFMLIPMIERHSRWFDAGPIAIAVEARALGDSPERMVRGPSIHVFNAARTEEYIRFDVFGKVLHYHYILNREQHNILWGYDPDLNGPMIPWACGALRDRLPAMLRRAGAEALACDVDEQGWDSSVLPEVARVASEALAPREDDMVRAQEGLDWMYEWKRIHPQFNTVDDGDY